MRAKCVWCLADEVVDLDRMESEQYAEYVDAYG